MAGELILLVDDEPHIIQLAKIYLEREGYRTHSVGDGKQALEVIPAIQPNLMVLDVMLPELDGIEVCRKLRAQENDLPIIMLTARDEDVDKILGLEMGADDYMTKPFNPRELTARVKAILRRNERPTKRADQPLQVGDLMLYGASREMKLAGKKVALRTQEFDLLWVLVENRERVLSRERLLELAWGFDYYGQTRTVDVHIGHLRKKLAGSSATIETVTGVGYKLVG